MGVKIGGGGKLQTYDDNTGRYGCGYGISRTGGLTLANPVVKVMSVPKENFDLDPKSEYSKALMDELKKQGRKFTSQNVVGICKNSYIVNMYPNDNDFKREKQA